MAEKVIIPQDQVEILARNLLEEPDAGSKQNEVNDERSSMGIVIYGQD